MALTVTQRISAGFAGTGVGLLLIAVVSIYGMQRVKGDMTNVADRAAPMVEQGGQEVASLLQASRALSMYYNGRTADELATARTAYDEAMANFKKADSAFAGLVGDEAEISRAKEEVVARVGKFNEAAPQLLSVHETEVTAATKVKTVRGRFEGLADELDADLSDLADSGRGARGPAAKLAKQVGSATVAAIDALTVTNPASLASIIRDLDDSAADIDEQIAALKAAGGDQDLIDRVTRHRGMVSGPDSLAVAYKQQLEAAAQSKEAYAVTETALGEALTALSGQMAAVKTYKDDAKASAESAIGNGRLIIIAASLIVIGLATGFAIWVVNSIRKPMDMTMRVLDEVARGDMTRTVDLNSDDEFGHLAKSVNRLTQQLRTMMQQITDSASSLASAADQTSRISQGTHEAISHQREQTEQVVVAMTQMASTVEEVARSANNTLSQVTTATQETTAGRQVVHQSIEAINRLAREVESSVEVINRLDQFSAQIGTVLDVIRGVAEQTNLLALNAAIEAARAGEQGRGFAVVADEVRTLASRTQSSTAEIQQTIERLQAGAREAVQAMARSKREAEASVEQTARAGESLQRITTAMGIINDMSTQIASAAEEQTAVTQEMHKNMTSISSVSEQTANGAAETLSASQDLARLAETLQHAVRQFKV